MRRRAKAIIAISGMLLSFALGGGIASAAAPLVTVEDASGVSYASADVKGTVDPQGKATTYRFQYVTQSQFEAEGFANPTTAIEETIEGSGDQAVEGEIGLSPDTTYHLRLFAENADGQAVAVATNTFTTKVLPAPSVATAPASGVSYTKATLNGTVNPNGGPLSIFWYFEYSKDPDVEGWTYGGGGEISGAEAEGSSPIPVSATPEGLSQNAHYVYRLTAVNAGGSVETGEPRPSFETLAVAKPLVTLAPVTGIGTETAHFSGTVDPNAPGAAPQDPAFDTDWHFECEPACPGLEGHLSADDQAHPIEVDASELEPGVLYKVKLIATNLGGSTQSEVQFTTDPLGPTAVTGLGGDPQATSALLTGYVDPQNQPTTYSFEWGTQADLSDAQTLPASGSASAGAGDRQVAVAQPVSGLSPSTTYYFRLTSDSPIGPPAVGAIASFKTFPAQSDDSCPNEAVRIAQNAQYLPSCRAYELVSDPDKVVDANAEEVSVDGNRVSYVTKSGTNLSTRSAGLLISTRTASGWSTVSAYPSRPALGGQQSFIKAYNPDLTAVLVESTYTGQEGPTKGLYRYVPETGELTQVVLGQGFRNNPDSEASDDLTHFFSVRDSGGIYDFGSGTAEVISLQPDGTPAACSDLEWGEFQSSNRDQHWISEDGRRVFFGSRGDDCAAPMELYEREAGPGGSLAAGGGGSTTLISAPALAGPLGEARFIAASPDGSRVFYSTPTRLDPDDTNAVTDIYRYTIGQGNECITCSVPDPGVITSPPRQPQQVVVAENGSRVYFSSEKALAPGARRGTPNLYVWRAEDPGQLGFVASVETPTTSGGFGYNATVTPDGSALVFSSARSELNTLTGSDNGGFHQFYRYDDRDRTISCVTCPHDRPASGDRELSTRILQGFGTRRRALSSDGRFFFFETPDPLVAGDTDNAVDIYQWHDGRFGILTDGSVATFAPPRLRIATADGSEVIISDEDQLASGTREGSFSTYAVRIDGGFMPPAPPVSCAGEGCRSPLASPPGEEAVATATFSGPGNAKAKARCRKGTKRKAGRCVKAHGKGKKQKKHGKTKGGAGKGGKR